MKKMQRGLISFAIAIGLLPLVAVYVVTLPIQFCVGLFAVMVFFTGPASGELNAALLGLLGAPLVLACLLAMPYGLITCWNLLAAYADGLPMRTGKYQGALLTILFSLIVFSSINLNNGLAASLAHQTDLPPIFIRLLSLLPLLSAVTLQILAHKNSIQPNLEPSKWNT